MNSLANFNVHEASTENRYQYTSTYQHGFITQNASRARVMNALGCDFEHVKEEERKRAQMLTWLDSFAFQLYHRPCSSYERSQAFIAQFVGDCHE